MECHIVVLFSLRLCSCYLHLPTTWNYRCEPSRPACFSDTVSLTFAWSGLKLLPPISMTWIAGITNTHPHIWPSSDWCSYKRKVREVLDPETLWKMLFENGGRDWNCVCIHQGIPGMAGSNKNPQDRHEMNSSSKYSEETSLSTIMILDFWLSEP